MRYKLFSIIFLLSIFSAPLFLNAQTSQLQLKMMKIAYDDIIQQNPANEKETSKIVTNLKNFLEVYKSDLTDTKEDNKMRKAVRERINKLKKMEKGDITEPEPLNIRDFLKEIQYTTEARKQGIEGKVVIKLTVDENGNPKNPEIVKGLHRDLDQNALQAARTLKFKPGTSNGQPVAMEFTMPAVTYRLDN